MKPKTSAHIKVISVRVTPKKQDSAQTGLNRIVSHIRHQFIIESFFGVNRLYLLHNSRIIQWLGFILSALFITITVYITIQHGSGDSTSYRFVKQTSSIEYICLIFFSILCSKRNLKNLFNDLSEFDHALDLTDELNITAPTIRFWIWSLLGFFIDFFELIFIVFFTPEFLDMSFLWSYVTILAHDYEQLLFCTLLRTILMRTIILKAYVIKTFSTDGQEEKKFNKVEALSNKAQLDITSLHRNYELLHKCAEQLNSVMNFPMALMLFCSGFSSTMLLKNVYKQLQSPSDDSNAVRTMIIHCIERCIKYTVLVIVPCYFSSQTTIQVTQMRTILHDAMNGVKTSKLERRRLKAFFQLTKENEFSYALWGVIRLNMSLPLNYLSLCTTYLVIIIQFSKFID